MRKLKPFIRELPPDQEPTDHQRRFLFLPFAIFQDFTNIEKIVSDQFTKKHGKKPPLFVLKKTIQTRHKNLSQLDKWKEWGLNKLKFKPSQDDQEIEASIWSKDVEEQEKIHQRFSDHEKQFGYLPLHIIKEATNLRELFASELNGREHKFDILSRGIHEQMHKPWAKILKNLRFVTEDTQYQADDEDVEEENDEATENVKTSTKEGKPTKAAARKSTASKSTDPEPVPSTSKQPPIVRSPKKSAKPATILDSSDRELRKRKSNSVCDEEEALKKSKRIPTDQQTDDTQRRQQKQSTLPAWLNKMSKPKVIQEDLCVGKVPKMAKVSTKDNPPKVSQTEAVVVLHQSRRESVGSPPVIKPAEDKQIDSSKNEIIPTESLDINSNQEHSNPTQTSTDKTHPSADQSLADRHEYNAEDRQNMRETYTPSKFQKEILELEFEDFISKTNVKDLIQEDYRKLKKDENAHLSDEAMLPRLEFYFQYRERTRDWHKNNIKNLKFIECDCKRKKPNEISLDSNNQSNKDSGTGNPTNSSKWPAVEPTEFQKEIIAMDFDTFVEETNIKDLVIRDFNRQFDGAKQITEKDMEFGLSKYDIYRKKPHKWAKNSLIDLKYKKCECKRHKQFVNETTQTEPTECHDNDTQCCSMDLNTSEEQRLQAVQGLQIHGIEDNQIYHFVYVTSTDAENQEPQNQLQEVQPNIAVDCVYLAENVMLTTVQQSQNVNQSDAETHYSTSQSASGSTQSTNRSSQCTNLVPFTPAESQQVISLAEVRMSEFIESHPPAESEDALARNPLETQAVPENLPEDIVSEMVQDHDMDLPSQRISQFDPQEVSTPVSSSVNTSRLASDSQNEPKTPEDNQMLLKIEPSTFLRLSQLSQDSDVECLGMVIDEIIEIPDDNETEEYFFECINHNLKDSTDTSIPQQNEPIIETQSELISILAGDSPVIEDSESPLIESPLRDIENIQQPTTTARPPPKGSIPPAKRTVSVPAKVTAVSKKRKIAHDDSLKNIPVPKYHYGPLNFHVRDRTKHNEQPTARGSWSETNPNPIQVPTHENEPNYSIEDSSSTDESNLSGSNADRNNGIVTDSCVERANLLNQDNSLFLNVNTQIINSGGSSTSQLNQQSQSLTTNAIIDDATTSNLNKNTNQPEAVLLPTPGPSTLSTINNDQTEFLHYVDITKVISSLKSIINDSGNRSRRLDIETTLQHQCNANNRIVVKADALKSIMKLTDKEWNAVLFILSKIETFQFESKNLEPFDVSLLHRTMYHLFKTASKISNVHIAYGDHDLETARVVHKSNSSNENITPAINQFVLSKMKETIQQQHEQNEPI